MKFANGYVYVALRIFLANVAFCQSISEELAHFPTGPALEDKFWLYLITWHIGLFVTMLLGQIGWQGRKQGYFK